MPGIHLYSSNRLEILADTFAELLRTAPLPPLQTETVLVQSRGMARWLAMETAARLNIWANCDCPFPNTFIRRIYQLLLPDIPDTTPYDRENIIWHVMDILPEFLPDPDFHIVASYLDSDNDLKLYQLAYETADLFDQYTLYRPDMILQWEMDTKKIPAAQAWQAKLWLRLTERLRRNGQPPEYHRAGLLRMFEENISSPDFDGAQLPPRVSVFGITSLPPYHLRVLAALAQHTDLHFFVMNPCLEYWFDIIADRDIVKISRKEAVDQNLLHLREGNSLLASMGHLGRDFMALLQELNAEEHDFFREPGENSLLARIQRDILYLRSIADITPGPDREKEIIHSRDASLGFHSCHSPMREVEILHEQLLEIFDRPDTDDPIEPRDILVMAPEIEEYAPIIRAVFDADPATNRKIPYTISDLSFRKSSRYIESFLDILLVAHGRCRSIDVVTILASEAVKKRFSLNDKDIEIIEDWIRKTRICWGIDEDHKADLQLPPYRENTWRAGLDRMLLGYAMPGHGRLLFENVLPYDHIEGNNTDLLGKFLEFTEGLFSLAESLQQPHTLARWSEVLLCAKDRLLRADEDSEAEDRILQMLLYRLNDMEEMASFTKEISLGVVRSYIINSLDKHFSPLAGGAGFLAGGVTFCSMLPMRSIPFKVICLLGMNDGMYPRAGRRKSFDLMAIEPKRGDRSRRYDDRYLFLETILSARRKLSISYVGQSIQDGSRRPPSVLVSELMDYIDQGYSLGVDQDKPETLSGYLTTLHHLQPFHHDYFKSPASSGREKFFSYSAENCEAAITLSAVRKTATPLFGAPMPAPHDEFRRVELHELVRFFSHPVRYLLVKVVGIAPVEESQPLETSEPFTLQGLAQYKLADEILHYLITGRDCDELYQVKKAAGELPHGRTGEFHFAQLASELRLFHKSLAELLSGQEFGQLQVNLKIDEYTISGNLENVCSMGLVQYRYAAMKPKDVIRSWICHLILNSSSNRDAPKSGLSTFFAEKKNIYKYSPADESHLHLKGLLDLYWQGLTEPLYFFPQASFAFAREIHRGNEQEALRKAVLAWEGNDFNREGEKNDPYNLLCCRNMDLSNPLFIEQAKKIFLPALEHQEIYK